jgi:hypothetical protein
MNRKPLSTSKDLRTRAFGTMGRQDASNGTSIGFGKVVDLSEETLRRPVILQGAGGWKPHAGRIYNFPLRKEPDGK